jgi:hypothetical protein
MVAACYRASITARTNARFHDGMIAVHRHQRAFRVPENCLITEKSPLPIRSERSSPVAFEI